MPSDIAIKIENLSKCYQIYETPRDRLKQFVIPKAREVVLPLLQSLAIRDLPQDNYYKEFWALKDVSFEVKKGETVGIVGRNGSGKSTLLQLICGTLNPTRGTIQTNGRIAALLELGSGFNLDFTGRENVYLNGSVLGLTTEEIDKRFDDILAFAEIGDFIEQPVKTYSSGMIVRLAFAVAINVDPEILIVDEALAVGDELFQRKCFSRIEAIRAAGSTILFVSHSGGTVVELCDRAIFLDDGELLACGTPKNIVGKYQELLYASVDKRSDLREKIKSQSAIGGMESSQLNFSIISTEIHSVDVQNITESFDPNFISQSVVSYEARGAIIDSVQIVTLDEKPVNSICRGKEYIYRYIVHFNSPAYFVRAGAMLKTITGLELGGLLSHAVGTGIKYIEENTVLQFSFRFKCLLLPGVYFFNAGVVGQHNGEEVYLNRLIDAYTFRVLNDGNQKIVGLIDIGSTLLDRCEVSDLTRGVNN